MPKKTWTITFGDCAENHKGMQIMGEKKATGFSSDNLKKYQKKCEKVGYETELINLEKLLPKKYKDLDSKDTEAHILVVKNGVKMLLGEKGSKKFKAEMESLDDVVDKKAFMYGRVVDKKARYNLCFNEKSQEPDYENKKGTVVAFKDVKYLNKIRESLPIAFGSKATDLLAELNYYYDVKKCFIGRHGDTERKRVIGVRLGANFPLHYQWYIQGKKIGKELTIDLEGNDIYIMSEKAVGTDWKRKIIPTLRHSAGFPENIK